MTDPGPSMAVSPSPEPLKRGPQRKFYSLNAISGDILLIVCSWENLAGHPNNLNDWMPLFSAVITGVFGVIVALINRWSAERDVLPNAVLIVRWAFWGMFVTGVVVVLVMMTNRWGLPEKPLVMPTPTPALTPALTPPQASPTPAQLRPTPS